MANGCKNTVTDCEDSVKKIMSDSVEKYQHENGTAAKERILVAISAQLKQRQIQGILENFKEPKMAKSFKQFSDAFMRYEASLASVTYQDIKIHHSEDGIDKLSVWIQRRISMGLDLVKTNLNKDSNTRFAENKKAAEQLLFAGIDLNQKIKELKIPRAQQDQLIKEVADLNDSMREQYQRLKNEIGSEANLALVVTGGVASAALVVGSAGTLGPAFLSAIAGNAASSFVGGTLSGAMGGAGITGLTKITDMALSSEAIAKNNASSFVCELGKTVDNEGRDALLEMWNSSLTSAVFGGVLGPTLGFLAQKSPKAAIMAGALIAIGGVENTIVSIQKNRDTIEFTNNEVKNFQKKLQDDNVSKGKIIDAKAWASVNKAHATANIVGDVVTAGTLIVGMKGATLAKTNAKTGQELSPNERITKARNLLGNYLSDKQKIALEEAHLVGKGEMGKDGVHSAGINNYTVSQLRKKATILQRGDFSKEETRKLIESGTVGIFSSVFEMFGGSSSEHENTKTSSTHNEKSASETEIEINNLITPKNIQDIKAKLNSVPTNLTRVRPLNDGPSLGRISVV